MGSILALDQSLSRTGWALWSSESGVVSGSWPLARRASMRGEAYRELWGHVDQIHTAHPLDIIIHERPAFGAANQGEDQLLAACGMIGVLELYAISRGIKVCAYSVQSWRSSWFSKAESKAIRAKAQKLRDWKGRALTRARQLGFECSSHDEAEAIAILDHHLMVTGVDPSWRARGLMLDPVA